LSEETVALLLGDGFELFAIWSHRGMVVARGRTLSDPSPFFMSTRTAAAERGWTLRWEPAGGEQIVFVSAHGRRSLRMPIILFALTVFTVVFLRPYMLAGFQTEGLAELFWAELPFAYALLPILLAHEFGHYFAARRHQYPASLPYFIPGVYPFGTFGALIIARYPFRDRRVLFDVAVAGPLAGFLVCIPVLWYGLSHSTWIHLSGTEGLLLGDPLLMRIMASWVLPPAPEPGMDIVLHAAAFGGWAGLFVTMLNLLPFGPLDGGKTAYALFGAKQKWIAVGFWFLLFASLFYNYYFWILWLGLALVFRLPHPPTLNDHVPLGRTRKLVGIAVIAVFVLSFMPLPFRNVP
jgi:membrane-associated protease RseP (regulator of RpoE activity)